MMTRAKKIIMHLIALETRRRQKFWNSKKYIPSDFSDHAIDQMRDIVKNKDLPFEEEQELLTEIKTFELTTGIWLTEE